MNGRRYCSKICSGLAHRGMRANPVEKFWSNVDQTGDCWLWMAGASNGYGTIRVGKQNIGTHVFSWTLHNGPVPDGLFVCHTCDVKWPPGDPGYRRCVRPDHLFLGTRAENSLDMWAKGRGPTGERSGARKHPERYPRGDQSPSRLHPERLARGDRNGLRLHPESVKRGEQNGSARLTDAQVIEMRRRYAAGGVRYPDLAAEYGVCLNTVAMIIRRERWKHLS